MTRRCLIVTTARPSATGAANWRRFLALAEHHDASGLETHALVLTEEAPGRDAARHLLAAVPRAGFAALDEAGRAVETLDARWDFDVMHFAAPEAAPWIGARRRAVRLTDAAGLLMASGRIADWAVHTDIFVAFEPDEVCACEEDGRAVILAPYLRRGQRVRRARLRGQRLLAGLWIERDVDAIHAARAFLDIVRTRGGGDPPNFAIAGPGADEITPPPMPRPVTVFGPDVAERVFYRGLDLAIFPDIEGHGTPAPRYDLAAALEQGATPLASSAALTGFRASWRLPAFENLGSLAEYLFEKGRAMREGGLLSDLAARADWTWSGLAAAAESQRAALKAAIKGRLREEADE